MSDREGHSGGIPAADDDLSLPKATVTKMITGEFGICTTARFSHTALVNVELLPSEVTCAKETRDLIIECCVGEQYSSVCWDDNSNSYIWLTHAEFIHLISSEANEICELESKKTIAPEHIIGALKVSHLSRQDRASSL